MDFKVGQRVRRIREVSELAPLGSVGTIASAVGVWCGNVEYQVAWDHMPGDVRWWLANTLAPLTDPDADAFIANIKKLKPLDTYTEHFAEVWRELTGIQR